MPDIDPTETIAALAERIVDEVGLREPDWVSLAEWARELSRLCDAEARSD